MNNNKADFPLKEFYTFIFIFNLDLLINRKIKILLFPCLNFHKNYSLFMIFYIEMASFNIKFLILIIKLCYHWIPIFLFFF